MTDAAETSSSRRAHVTLYGLSFAYTIVIGIAGGALIKQALSASSDADQFTVQKSETSEWALVGEENGVSCYLTRPYNDGGHGEQLAANILKDLGLEPEQSSLLALTIQNTSNEAVPFNAASGAVCLTVGDTAHEIGNRTVTKERWGALELRAKQFLQSASIPVGASGTFWLIFPERLSLETVKGARIVLGNGKAVVLEGPQPHSRQQ